MFPGELKKMNGSPSISAHLSHLSNLLFVSWEDNTSLIGRLELEREPEVISGCRLNPMENKEKAAILPHLGRSGNIFSGFEDISADETTFYAAAIIRKGSKNLDFALGNFGIGVVLKITKENILYQPIINPMNLNAFRVESFVSFDLEQKGVKNYYLLCIMEDGSLQINQVNPSGEIVAQDIPVEVSAVVSNNILTDIDNLIKPQTLENSGIKQTIVTNELLNGRTKSLAVDYMEKAFAFGPTVVHFEDEISKITNPQLQANLKSGLQPSASAQLDKNSINVSHNYIIHIKNRLVLN